MKLTLDFLVNIKATISCPECRAVATVEGKFGSGTANSITLNCQQCGLCCFGAGRAEVKLTDAVET